MRVDEQGTEEGNAAVGIDIKVEASDFRSSIDSSSNKASQNGNRREIEIRTPISPAHPRFTDKQLQNLDHALFLDADLPPSPLTMSAPTSTDHTPQPSYPKRQRPKFLPTPGDMFRLVAAQNFDVAHARTRVMMGSPDFRMTNEAMNQTQYSCAVLMGLCEDGNLASEIEEIVNGRVAQGESNLMPADVKRMIMGRCHEVLAMIKQLKRTIVASKRLQAVMADVEVEEELPERVNSLSGSGPGNQAFRQMLAQRLDARGGPSNAQGGISDPRKSPSNVAVVHRKVGDRFTI